MLGVGKNFYRPFGGKVNGWTGVISEIEPRMIAERKNYRVFGKMFLFVAAFVDRITELELAATMRRVYARYSDYFADATGDVRQRARIREQLGGWIRRKREFNCMLVERFDEQCDFARHSWK